MKELSPHFKILSFFIRKIFAYKRIRNIKSGETIVTLIFLREKNTILSFFAKNTPLIIGEKEKDLTKLSRLSLFFIFWRQKMLERDFQARLIKELNKRFEGCLVFKSDPEFRQGIPDLFVLYNSKWAALECKKSDKAKHQPNQDYYVDKCNDMSFARFICPENKKEVLDELERAFRT